VSDHACDPAEGCITCGDTAVEMRVLQVDEARELALCADEAGNRSSVEIALVKPIAPGDGVLVHAGTALGRLTPEGAVA
jgi:hydrogenase maturation factor